MEVPQAGVQSDAAVEVEAPALLVYDVPPRPVSEGKPDRASPSPKADAASVASAVALSSTERSPTSGHRRRRRFIWCTTIFLYIKAEVRPLPHSIANRTSRSLLAFRISSYIVGAAVGVTDGILITLLAISSLASRFGQSGRRIPLLVLACAISVAIACILAFGPLLFTILAQRRAFSHACANDWIVAELDVANSLASPATIAIFSLPQQQARPLFRMSLDTTLPKNAVFSVIPPVSSSSGVIPAISAIHYDFSSDSHRIFGDGLNGSFDDARGSYLTFNFTDSSQTPITLRNLYREWSFDDKPSVLLARTDTGNRILQTAIVDPDDCTRLRVCVPHPDAQPDGIVPVEALLPTGWILFQHLRHVRKSRCSIGGIV
ncbi:hypothetical protein EXIGLDRAFT_704142 [Exidia glandulosa HHB12029]|uniref:Uncharacterized protein n=1 Tax=Exidia glandulosa HHB12029 TaxID=1314781 RepID=A0A165KYD1_EXIGL|nr:hypothetical protein EXIGLDRAFT_704142 [Exidia glandulosa HHB12029]